MDNPSNWRLENARRLSEVFAAEPQVKAIVLTGAVAEGIADGFSETHLHAFWTELPSIDQQHRVLERIGGTSVFGVEELELGVPAEGYAPFRITTIPSTTGASSCDAGSVDGPKDGGYPIELENDTLGTTEQCLSEVLIDHVVERFRFELLGTIQQGMPLYGDEIVAQWKERIGSYPFELKRRVIENATAEMWKNIRYAQVLVEREDIVEYFRVLTVIAHNFLKLLFGLNGIFGWQETPKRYRWQVERFTIKPDDFYRRICDTFSRPIEHSLMQLTFLARETVEIATDRVPNLHQLLSRHITSDPPTWDGSAREVR